MTTMLAMLATQAEGVPPKLAAAIKELAAAEDRLAKARRDRAAQLRHLHRIGWTWGELGEFLGVSRQRAQQMSEQHY